MPEPGARGEAGRGDGEAGTGLVMPMAGRGTAREGMKSESDPDTGLGEVAGCRGRVEFVPGKPVTML